MIIRFERFKHEESLGEYFLAIDKSPNPMSWPFRWGSRVKPRDSSFVYNLEVTFNGG